MATWSSMLRASRSTLWTTTASTSPVSAIRESMARSRGRSAVRADSPLSTYSSQSSQPSSRMRRTQASRWAAIEKPSSVRSFSACSFVETRR